jgi:hypothetical protein
VPPAAAKAFGQFLTQAGLTSPVGSREPDPAAELEP